MLISFNANLVVWIIFSVFYFNLIEIVLIDLSGNAVHDLANSCPSWAHVVNAGRVFIIARIGPVSQRSAVHDLNQ